MQKRIKSFFISLSSILFVGFLAIVISPEWATFVADAKAYFALLGVPSSVVAIFGLFIAESWKAYLNKRAIAKQASDYRIPTTQAKPMMDLY